MKTYLSILLLVTTAACHRAQSHAVDVVKAVLGTESVSISSVRVKAEDSKAPFLTDAQKQSLVWKVHVDQPVQFKITPQITGFTVWVDDADQVLRVATMPEAKADVPLPLFEQTLRGRSDSFGELTPAVPKTALLRFLREDPSEKRESGQFYDAFLRQTPAGALRWFVRARGYRLQICPPMGSTCTTHPTAWISTWNADTGEWLGTSNSPDDEPWPADK